MTVFAQQPCSIPETDDSKMQVLAH